MFLLHLHLFWKVFFRKPTRPSLPLRKAPPFSPSLSSMVFTTPSVPLVGDRNPQGREDVTALQCCFSKIIPSFFTIKEGSTSLLGLLPSGKKRKTALRCSEPLRYKVGGPSKVSPCCAGWDRLEIGGYDWITEEMFLINLLTTV